MSQAETLLYVILGFAFAILLALTLGRFSYRLALRSSDRRRPKAGEAAPEIVALRTDRDRIRAEQALLARKLEVRLADVESRMAEYMVEVSRYRNRIDGLTSDLTTRDKTISQHEAELGLLRQQYSTMQQQVPLHHPVVNPIRPAPAPAVTVIHSAPPVEKISKRIADSAKIIFDSRIIENSQEKAQKELVDNHIMRQRITGIVSSASSHSLGNSQADLTPILPSPLLVDTALSEPDIASAFDSSQQEASRGNTVALEIAEKATTERINLAPLNERIRALNKQKAG